jgi:hypothetical protein
MEGWRSLERTFMNEGIILAALLIAGAGLGARMCVEQDPLDVLLFSGILVSIGYLIPKVF